MSTIRDSLEPVFARHMRWLKSLNKELTVERCVCRRVLEVVGNPMTGTTLAKLQRRHHIASARAVMAQPVS